MGRRKTKKIRSKQGKINSFKLQKDSDLICRGPSIFSPLEMISIKIWETPLSWNTKCSLPVAVCVSKTRVLKLPKPRAEWGGGLLFPPPKLYSARLQEGRLRMLQRGQKASPVSVTFTAGLKLKLKHLYGKNQKVIKY